MEKKPRKKRSLGSNVKKAFEKRAVHAFNKEERKKQFKENNLKFREAKKIKLAVRYDSVI